MEADRLSLRYRLHADLAEIDDVRVVQSAELPIVGNFSKYPRALTMTLEGLSQLFNLVLPATEGSLLLNRFNGWRGNERHRFIAEVQENARY